MTTTTKIAGEAMQITDEQWYDLAQRHANADWNSDGYLAAIKAVCADYALLASKAAVPTGWKLVPVEPTDEMMLQESTCKHHAPFDMSCSARSNRMRIYRAMLAASPTAPAQSCGEDAPTYAEFGTARERFLSGAPVQMSERVRELASQALAARNSDTRTDDEKISAAVDFICDTRLDQPVKCGDAEQADDAVTDDVFGWLETEVTAISCRYHGDPSYDHDAYWMRDRVVKLIGEARNVFAARAKDSK